jgi:salicylate hydroxylase
MQLGVEVKVNCKVIKYDMETPSVELANGTLLLADLIIGADGELYPTLPRAVLSISPGVKSIARQLILGGVDQAPKSTGFAAYRATVDVEKIQADPELSWITEQPSLNIWIGEGRHVMTYTMAAGKSFNMVLSHVDRSPPSTWKSECALEDMRMEFSGWDPQFVAPLIII